MPLLPAQAIRLYQNCLKKFHGGRDPSLHIYLAHAYFDARQYNDCMRVLLKALHVSPNNLQLWYNLALSRETFAVAVLQKEQKGEARTLAEVENAIEDLKVQHVQRFGSSRKAIKSRAHVIHGRTFCLITVFVCHLERQSCRSSPYLLSLTSVLFGSRFFRNMTDPNK